jgi:uncharacterized membrane protein
VSSTHNRRRVDPSDRAGIQQSDPNMPEHGRGVANQTRGPLIAAGTCIGIGLGGFVDGILFHQLLQAHSMLSARYPIRGVEAERLVIHLQVNMFWDGIFHVGTWLVTAMGLGLLWQAVRRPDVVLSTQTLIGSLLLGWGLFNLVEGVIDHHILHIHHVTETASHLVWDLSFLGFSAVLATIGWLLIANDSFTAASAPDAAADLSG